MSPTPPPPPPSTMEKGAVEPIPSKKWSLKKKILLAVVIAIVVIGLAVGLGVGLTVGRRKGEEEGEGGNNNNNNGGGGGGEQPGGGNKNTTWLPPVAANWQIQLGKPLDTSKDLIPGVDIYDIDMFDNPQSTFKTLQDQGKKVICYFSAGSYEDWRGDAKDFKPDDMGNKLEGWRGEKWLKLDSDNVRDIMKKRIKYASDKGCDAIDPDNVDGYQNDNGLDLKPEDSVSFMKFLSSEARALNMSIGLKNAGSIIKDVLPAVDFSVNEQCIQYSECEKFAAFIQDRKPVFNIEYPSEMQSKSVEDGICSGQGNAKGTKDFSIVIKDMGLDKKVDYCNGKTYK